MLIPKSTPTALTRLIFITAPSEARSPPTEMFCATSSCGAMGCDWVVVASRFVACDDPTWNRTQTTRAVSREYVHYHRLFLHLPQPTPLNRLKPYATRDTRRSTRAFTMKS
jgi:hypothetical protein